jgi:hypothetical protein
MKKSTVRTIFPIVIGLLLILTGVIFLLDNLNIISLNWEVLVGPLFALGGLVFLVVFIMDTDNWWALIPGMALIGLGMTIFMDQGSFSGAWSGAVFLGMLALSFWLVYAFHPSNWWAVIPGGVLMTLAAVSVIPGDGNLSGGVFFLGMALTFGLLYLLPNPIGKVKWALIPAGILAIFGVLILLGSTGLINYVWPVALLLAGGVVLVRAILKK